MQLGLLGLFPSLLFAVRISISNSFNQLKNINQFNNIKSGGVMVVKRKVALMALHSHLIKTENFNWANCVLRYLHGFKLENYEIWVNQFSSSPG